MEMAGLLQLGIMNLKATYKRNLIYLCLFIMSLTALMTATFYWSKVCYSLDGYLNSFEGEAYFRQLQWSGTDIDFSAVQSVKEMVAVQSISLDSAGVDTYLITMKDYRDVEVVANHVSSLNKGVLLRNTEKMLDLRTIAVTKYGLTTLVLFVATLIVMIIRMNITQSIDDRIQEISLYRALGYSNLAVCCLLYMEMMALLSVSAGISVLCAQSIIHFWVDPVIVSMNINWLSIAVQLPSRFIFPSILVLLIAMSLASIFIVKQRMMRVSPIEFLK